MQMSGSSKVEMSAFPAQCRDGWTPHVEHEGAGSPAGSDADRRAAPDAPARGGAASDRRAPGATPQSYPPRERRACLGELVQLEPGVLAAIVDMPPPPARAAEMDKVRRMIEEGTVGAGMTREQVLMALGYPPAHRTPRLDAPVWMYCADREDTFEVYFDGDRVSRVNRQQKGHGRGRRWRSG